MTFYYTSEDDLDGCALTRQEALVTSLFLEIGWLDEQKDIKSKRRLKYLEKQFGQELDNLEAENAEME